MPRSTETRSGVVEERWEEAGTMVSTDSTGSSRTVTELCLMDREAITNPPRGETAGSSEPCESYEMNSS